MNNNKSDNLNTKKVPLEAALDKVGFGLYSYLLTALGGLMIVCLECIAYNSMFVVPTSACELNTTTAQQGLLASGPVLGLLTVTAWGYLADTRGRRYMLLVSLTCAAVFNLIATFSVNWIMLLVLQFLAAVSASGLYSMVMTLVCESVPMAKRSIAVLVVSSIFFLSPGLMALLAIPITRLTFSYYIPVLGIYWNSWRTLMALFSIPCLISAVCLYFMQESPKYVFVKGDEDGALEILKTIYKINNRGNKEELQIKGLLKDEMTVTTGRASTKDQIVPLFKPPLLKFIIIMLILYFTQQMTAFMIWLPTIADRFMRSVQGDGNSNLTMCGVLSLEAAPVDPDATPCALNETALLFVLGAGVLQCIVSLINSTLVNTVGRRNIVLVVVILCGVSGILVNLVPNIIGSMILFTIMITGFVVCGLYTAICVALFPTNLRAMAVSITTTGTRLGTVASTQILNLLLVKNCEAGFYLFASLFGASSIVAALLPDDRHSVAPTLAPDEIENTYDKNKQPKIS